MICQLSVLTGISPAELARLDQPTLMTLGEAVAERDERDSWTTLHEQIARVYDLLAVMRSEALIGKVKTLPRPKFMPRPGEKSGPVVVSPSEAARLMAVS